MALYSNITPLLSTWVLHWTEHYHTSRTLSIHSIKTVWNNLCWWYSVYLTLANCWIDCWMNLAIENLSSVFPLEAKIFISRNEQLSQNYLKPSRFFAVTKVKRSCQGILNKSFIWIFLYCFVFLLNFTNLHLYFHQTHHELELTILSFLTIAWTTINHEDAWFADHIVLLEHFPSFCISDISFRFCNWFCENLIFFCLPFSFINNSVCRRYWSHFRCTVLGELIFY